MGANSRRRREARRRRGRATRAEEAFERPGFDSAQAYGEAALGIEQIVRVAAATKVDDLCVRLRLEALLSRLFPAPREVVVEAMGDQLSAATARLRQGGWDVSDLQELARRADESLVEILERVTAGGALRLSTTDDFIHAVRLAVRLSMAPTVDVRALGPRPGTSRQHAEHPKLRQVRALLAKAESTQFEAEAQALMDKAQQLIATHSLEQLVNEESVEHLDGFELRRIWLDAPYVRAKGGLVAEVGRANRCRVAFTPALGYSLVVGAPADVAFTELLVTSLLMQAQQAVARRGSVSTVYGESRTRSFRRSFLEAFAFRVGQRLREVADQVAATTDDGRHLPALRHHEERVEAAFTRAVHTVRARSSAVSDAEGWAAGVVAADLARLDMRDQVAPPGLGLTS